MNEPMEHRVAELENRVVSLEKAVVALVGAPAPKRREMTIEEFKQLCGDYDRPKDALSRYLEESIKILEDSMTYS